MNLIEKLGAFINGDDEKMMIEKEHRKIQRMVEKAHKAGKSFCHYAHNSADGWDWDDRDYLNLRLWLNKGGFLSFRSKEGVYIIWLEDEDMASLNQRQRKILKRIEAKMKG